MMLYALEKSCENLTEHIEHINLVNFFSILEENLEVAEKKLD